MNISHVDKSKFNIPTRIEIMKAIFEKQHALMEKYGPIEEANGFPRPTATDIDDPQLQFKVKDFFWRATEEIAESYEVVRNPDQEEHIVEELIDSLHFIVEAAGLCGYDHTIADELNWINPIPSTIEDRIRTMTETVMRMGIAANCLKNKPWKSTHMQTDKAYFRNKFRIVFSAYADMFGAFGLKAEDMYLLYCCKNEVNQFRQRSNY